MTSLGTFPSPRSQRQLGQHLRKKYRALPRRSLSVFPALKTPSCEGVDNVSDRYTIESLVSTISAPRFAFRLVQHFFSLRLNLNQPLLEAPWADLTPDPILSRPYRHVDINMSMFDTQSVSSRSTLSAFPSSTTSVNHDSRDKKAAGFVAPNSRRGGRDFKVVSKQKSDASIGFVKKDKGTRGFRRVLGELIAGRSNSRNVVVVPADEPSRDRPETPKPRIGNKTSEWVQEEARRSQLREHELRRHEAEMRASETTVESLDDQSFYAFVSD